MPDLKKSLAESRALTDAPTLGNLHPDARAQAIARAARSDGDRMAARLAWLHSPASHNVDGYEWGIFRVKWENGVAVEVWQTNGDFSDLDAAMSASGVRECPECGPVTKCHGVGPGTSCPVGELEALSREVDAMPGAIRPSEPWPRAPGVEEVPCG